jgi:ATP-dependent Clp protease ATP-binding subunit ClpA
MLSQELESCLNQAFARARSAHHEFLTIEYLLLAILDTPAVREVLKGCGAELDPLAADLQQYIAANNLLRVPAPGEEPRVQPDLGFQRVLQRAAFHVQSGGKKEVGVLEVLVAIFSEKHSHAVLLLTRMQVTRIVVVNYLAGLKPPSRDRQQDGRAP